MTSAGRRNIPGVEYKQRARHDESPVIDRRRSSRNATALLCGCPLRFNQRRAVLHVTWLGGCASSYDLIRGQSSVPWQPNQRELNMRTSSAHLLKCIKDVFFFYIINSWNATVETRGTHETHTSDIVCWRGLAEERTC